MWLRLTADKDKNRTFCLKDINFLLGILSSMYARNSTDDGLKELLQRGVSSCLQILLYSLLYGAIY